MNDLVRMQPGTYRCIPISMTLDCDGWGRPQAEVVLRVESTGQTLRKIVPLGRNFRDTADIQLAPMGIDSDRLFIERHVVFPEDDRVDVVIRCRSEGGGPYVASIGRCVVSLQEDHLDLDQLVGDKYALTWEQPVQDRNRHPGVSKDSLWWYRRIEGKHGHIGVWSRQELCVSCNNHKARVRLLAVPGIVVKQDGDDEFNATFPADCLDQVAMILGTRRRRQLSSKHKAKLAETAFRRKTADGL